MECLSLAAKGGNVKEVDAGFILQKMKLLDEYDTLLCRYLLDI
jgi:hypothetical protein